MKCKLYFHIKREIWTLNKSMVLVSGRKFHMWSFCSGVNMKVVTGILAFGEFTSNIAHNLWISFKFFNWLCVTNLLRLFVYFFSSTNFPLMRLATALYELNFFRNELAGITVRLCKRNISPLKSLFYLYIYIFISIDILYVCVCLIIHIQVISCRP